MSRPLLVLLFPLVTAHLAAQAAAPAPVTSAAGTITADDVIRRIRIIADDSMMGRDTPSPGLEHTAQWVADEFKRFGLQPGGENGTYFQRYPITRRKLLPDRSVLSMSAGSARARTRFDVGARLVAGHVPPAPVAGPAVLVGGDVTADAASAAPIRGRVVLFIRNPLSETTDQAIRALYLGGASAVVLFTELDSAAFVPRLQAQARERTVIDLGDAIGPVIEARAAPFAGVLRAAGVRPAAVAASRTAVIRELPKLAVRLELKEAIVSSQTAPNTIGILEGSDPKLKHEYVLFSAHMDHIGVTPGQPDSINNGADDDASGTVGVVELAEAFTQPGARPKRSLVFLTVSGEEKGLWGSRYFSEHPTVPLKDVVADLNSDMIGRNWADTIVAIGKEHSDLGATLNRVNAAHPELRMTAVDDRWPEERFYFRSDHYNFARKGIPILFFFNGVHEDYHRVTDSPDKIDAEKESRVVKLVFYLGQEVANAPERPKWNPESYREIVEQ